MSDYRDQQLVVLRDALRKIAVMHSGWFSYRMALVRERASDALNKADDIGRRHCSGQ